MSDPRTTPAGLRAAYAETKDIRFFDAANTLERTQQDGKDLAQEIDEAWDAFGTRADRARYTLAEQIAVLQREVDEATAARGTFEDADRVIAAIERLVPDFTSFRTLADAVEAALRTKSQTRTAQVV